ncbi:MAG TPA: hypothetical protein VEL07_14775 [Planctomycetota bacterium]|nr:hypothetical protein [Planctomycetota bacterium]
MPDPVNDDSNLGINGWYDPRRLVWALLPRLKRWPPILAAAGLMLGCAIGLMIAVSTWSLSATLRLVPAAQSMHVAESLDPYQVPDFHPAEVQSWFMRTTIFEKMQANERHESVDELKAMFTVDFDREASLFQASLSGATTAKDAEHLLTLFCNLVIEEARKQVRERIRADDDYYRLKAAEEQRRNDLARSRLIDFRKANAFTDVENESALRNQRLAEARQMLANAEARGEALRTRKEAILALKAETPAEIAGGRSLRTSAEERREQLRTEERRLAAVYTDMNPHLVAVRAELSVLDAAPTVEQAARPDAMMPNPVAGMLDQQLTQIALDEPMVAKELEVARQRLAEAEELVGALPPLASQFQRLAADSEATAALTRRLQARLAEIEIVHGLQGGQLQMSDAPNAAYARQRSKALKVGLAGLAGAFVGFGIGCLVALGQVLVDPFLRNLTDLRLVLRAQRAERLPVPATAIGEHRLWLQRLSEHVTGSAKSALLIPSGNARDSALIARALAEQVARSGLKTLLVADAGLLGLAPGKGLSHVLDRELHPEQALVELDQRLSLLAVGDLPRVLDQVPSGHVERLIGELASHFDFMLVAPPAAEIALVRRLTNALAGVIVVVSRDGMPRALAEEIARLERPVIQALLAD